MTTRAEVVEEARTLLGTPWVHQGCTAIYGLDCAGVLKVVGANKFGITSYEAADYPAYPQGNQLLAMLDKYLVRIRPAVLRAGRVITMRIAREPQHVGILADYLLGGFSMIHADNKIGRVVETRLDDRWLDRIVATHDFPGIEP